jgi:hypothetical protein
MHSANLQRAAGAASPGTCSINAARPRAAYPAPRRSALRSIPVPKSDIIGEEDTAKLEKMRKCFEMADVDG